MPYCISCRDEYKVLSVHQKCVLCSDTPIVHKPKTISCSECGEDFDPTSIARRKLGGKINQCIDCVDETAIKYAAVASGDGKGSQISILSFDSEEDKKKYIEFWKNVSGANKPKSCQLSRHASTDPKVKFKTITGVIASNHKGKA